MDITKERIKAIISAAIILIINVATMFNISLDQDIMIKAMFSLVDLVAMIWAIWKNHNFTTEAIQAQGYLNNLKEGR
jgi:hypothetical protein